jgi:hypothetical protein
LHAILILRLKNIFANVQFFCGDRLRLSIKKRFDVVKAFEIIIGILKSTFYCFKVFHSKTFPVI